MSLQKEFEAAVQQVNNLPADTAPQHMTTLYGLYKQATEGDVNMKNEEVDASGADQASGPGGLSQAQWDSWDKYKGTSEEDAKRQYVAQVAEITGTGAAGGTQAGEVVTDALTNAPMAPEIPHGQENDTMGPQPGFGPGDMTAGGLRGDITAGAPYGGEDLLKGQ